MSDLQRASDIYKFELLLDKTIEIAKSYVDMDPINLDFISKIDIDKYIDINTEAKFLCKRSKIGHWSECLVICEAFIILKDHKSNFSSKEQLQRLSK
ncbi:Hypothetical predicted protein [Octopus vulgaris]|uniref:Uncharacterized protein n=1 Tax=Octopus vulgaris TaxID=6645 RepID=A0AA36AR49_OCTVU|nr:Hypothetical predicted protein [Octopus vulgaris]